MATIKFTGITADKSMTKFEAYKSFFDRKIGDSVQTCSGEWHTIIFQTTDYETALAAIAALRRLFNRIAARRRRIEQREQAATLSRLIADAIAEIQKHDPEFAKKFIY